MGARAAAGRVLTASVPMTLIPLRDHAAVPRVLKFLTSSVRRGTPTVAASDTTVPSTIVSNIELNNIRWRTGSKTSARVDTAISIKAIHTTPPATAIIPARYAKYRKAAARETKLHR